MCEVTQALLDFLKLHEGVRTRAYLDPAKKASIGVGHLILPEDHLKVGDVISMARVDELLTKDVQTALSAVNRLVKVPLNKSQCVALVSFIFNVGVGAFRRSSVLKHLNLGHYQTAADRLLLWNKGGGKILPGLVRRRKAERELFLKF